MIKKEVLGIIGSTKSKSTSLAIMQQIKKAYEDQINLYIYKGIDKLPHFNPDLEKELPKEVLEFRELIKEADGIIICSPEYVFSLPGSLKNALEWTVSTVVFSDKPVAMIIAAASGEKAFESLDLILTTIECDIPIDSKLLIKGAKGKINNDGMISDQPLILKLDKLISSLIKSMDNYQKIPRK